MELVYKLKGGLRAQKKGADGGEKRQKEKGEGTLSFRASVFAFHLLIP